MIRIGIFAVLALYAGWLNAGHQHTEKWYQDQWCDWLTEHVLEDGTRVDCLTPDHAIEVDFARKWYEGVGQALHYARMTDRCPGVLLIIEHPDDCKYLKRLQSLSTNNRPQLKVWSTGPYAVRCE
ncbi:MAG: hypothetical protein K8I82_21455 [Anaerolineae bacterium]|nr:hypothetical protein [Anaerolineae bacterium]